MGSLARTMARKAAKAEKIAPNELADIRSTQKALAEAQADARELQMQAAEAQTTHDYIVMQIRRRYKLKVGDQITPEDGTIIRA